MQCKENDLYTDVYHKQSLGHKMSYESNLVITM